MAPPNLLAERGEKPGSFFGEASTSRAFGAVTRVGHSLGKRERDSEWEEQSREEALWLSGENGGQTRVRGCEPHRGSLAGLMARRKHWAWIESSLGLEQSFEKAVGSV